MLRCEGNKVLAHVREISNFSHTLLERVSMPLEVCPRLPDGAEGDGIDGSRKHRCFRSDLSSVLLVAGTGPSP